MDKRAGQLSLAIPPWIAVMNTGDGYIRCRFPMCGHSTHA